MLYFDPVLWDCGHWLCLATAEVTVGYNSAYTLQLPSMRLSPTLFSEEIHVSNNFINLRRFRLNKGKKILILISLPNVLHNNYFGFEPANHVELWYIVTNCLISITVLNIEEQAL